MEKGRGWDGAAPAATGVTCGHRAGTVTLSHSPGCSAGRAPCQHPARPGRCDFQSLLLSLPNFAPKIPLPGGANHSHEHNLSIRHRRSPPSCPEPLVCTLPPPKLPVFEQNRSRRSLSSISSTLFHRWLITPGLCWPNFGSVPKPRCPRPSPPPSPNPTFYISKPRSAASGANPFASSNAAAASQIPRWMQRGILTGLAAEMTNIY